MNKYFLVALVLFCRFSFAQNKDHKQIPLVNSGELMKDGLKLHDDGKYKEAVAKYLQISRNDTNYDYAQVELMLSYLSGNDSLNAIKVGNEALKIKSTGYRMGYYEHLGNAYDMADSLDKSIQTYQQGLKEFPYNYKYYFEMGVAYGRHNNDTAAARCFQKSIMMYPMHAGSHYQLGLLAMRNNKFVPALLSFQMFLMLEPGTARSQNVLQNIESIAKGGVKIDLDSVVDITGDKDHFDDLEQIIRSKSALTEKYKTDIKIKFTNITKTLQVMNEQLQYNSSDKGFWMQTYVPFFKELWKNDLFKPYMINAFSSVNDEDTQKEIKSNKSKIDKYVEWAAYYVTHTFPREPLVVNGKQYPQWRAASSSNHIKTIGEYDSKTKLNKGTWVYFHPGGYISSTGNYNDKGLMDGEWKMYYDDGSLKYIRQYRDDKLNGKYEEYYRNGQLKEKGIVVNGDYDGPVEGYYATGVKNYTMNFNLGKKNGPIKVWHPNGLLKREAAFRNDEYDGEYKDYYDNGQLMTQLTLTNGKANGIKKAFHSNGKLQHEGKLIAGNEDGEWKYYYENGKLEKSGMYKGGKATGIWKEYYENGTLSEEDLFSDGTLNGVAKYYDEDGVLYSEMTYGKNLLKKFKYIDKKGKIISQGEEKGGNIDLVTYYASGAKGNSGKIVNGKRNGVWTGYYENGQKKNEIEYKDNQKDGKAVYFYKNGKVKEKVTYKEDELDGYYLYYYKNGIIQKEGNYDKGTPVGDWVTYFSNGNKKSEYYLLNGNTWRYRITYNDLGKKIFEEYYDEHELLTEVSGFDTTGKVTFVQKLEKGSGDYKSYLPNKKLFQQAVFKNGQKDGEAIYYFTSGQKFIVEHHKNGMLEGENARYYENGKPYFTRYYKNDKTDSVTTYYYEDGTKELERQCKDGDLNGRSIWYFENGKKKQEGDYLHDERDGYFVFYAPDGNTVRYRMLYDKGRIVSYSYMDKAGSYVEDIPLKNESGQVIAYYPNGNKSAEFTLVNGFREGKSTFYHVNGKVMSEVNYKDDDMDGPYKEYYESGKVRKESNYYSDDINGTEKEYTEAGKLKREINYILESRYGYTMTYDPATGKLKKKTFYIDDQPYE